MSERFRNLFAALRKEVQTGSPRDFLEARARHPCLAAYPDLASVLADLGQLKIYYWPNRERLIRAIIAEYQETSLPFWGAVLLVMFCPMLDRLRNRTRDDILDSDDLDQLVIASFLKTVATFSSVNYPALVALRLRQNTQRYVFRALGRERAERDLSDKLTLFVEETDWNEFVDELALSEKEDPRSALVRVFDSHWPQIPPASRLVIFATIINNEPLRCYAQRMTCDSEAEGRVYERLRRRRSRAIEKLRELIGDGNERPAGALIPRSEQRAKGDER